MYNSSPLRRGGKRIRQGKNNYIETAPPMSASIALVDDDRNILTSVSIALQAEGFQTRIYSDGETALKAILDNPPALAVLDIKMPRMDGMELLRRVREKIALPVIFLQSKDSSEERCVGRGGVRSCVSWG